MGASFFERAPDVDCPRGRLLLLSYHFPPGQGAGAMRWQKLARFAAERGWGLDVITLAPESLPIRDDSRLDDLPDGTRVYGVREVELLSERLERGALAVSRRLRRLRSRGREIAGSVGQGTIRSSGPATPTSLSRHELSVDMTSLRSWFRAYWAWRNYACDGNWARRAADLGLEIFDPHVHRLVISCGPPHMVHEATRRLARKTKLPWAVDLRDPWSQGERIPENLASPLWLHLARRYERRAFNEASLIVMNTEPARRAVQQDYPELADSVIAVPNAYDDEPVPEVARDPRFLIAYAGTVYLDRTPATLFKAAARLIQELSLSPEQFAIEFMGNIGSVDGFSLDDIATREGLVGYVETRPHGDYAATQRFLASASMLVSLPQDSHLAIPSKIFDYMRFEASVLVLAERGSATEVLLRETTAAVVAPLDVEGVLTALRGAFLANEQSEKVERIGKDPRFSRRARAAHLFDSIEAVVPSTGLDGLD